MLFTLLVTAILLVLNISIYYLTSVDTREVFRKRLKSRAGNNAQIFDYFGDSSVAMLRRIDEGSLAILPQKSVSIYDTTGNLLYNYQAANADSLLVEQSLLDEVRLDGEHYFSVGAREAIALYYPDSRRSFLITVAAYNEDGLERLSDLKKILVVSLFFGVLVTLITGFVFSSQLVKPISDITKEVNAISSHNLSKRLATGISQDELNQLAKTFNNLLDRLQDSFSTQRRFISHASHELSTPLTSISSQLQVTLQNERTSAEYQRVLQSIQEDVEQMRQLTKSLLEIAKTGAQGSIELSELRVDELLLKIISDVKRSNHLYEVEMKFDAMPEDEDQCMVFGNFDLLYSAVRNIIENGCKYSPDKSSNVEVSFSKMHIHIKVMNQGDVITEAEVEQIFQPFFRGANAVDSKGFGLGLPLANKIISLHKGEINVTSGLKGTVFSITLPSLIHTKLQF